MEERGRGDDCKGKQKITLGIALTVAILATVVAVWIAVPLLLIAVLLFAWGLEPARTEAFAGRLL